MEGKGDLSGTAIGQLGRLASTCLKRTSSQSNRSGRARTKVRRRVRDDKINGHSSGEDDDVETVKIDCRPNLPKSEEKSELDSLVEIAEATVKEAEALKQSEMEQILLSSAEKPASEQILHVSEGEDDMNENNLKSHPSILQTLNRQSFFSTVTGDDNPVHGSSSKTAASSAQNDRRARFVASWLLTEFEPCVSSTLPRSTLYDRYQEVCVEVGMEPVNAATFGKIIRAVFTHLRTRRLGTRGNSKYHYEGIRPREGTLTATTLASEVSSTGAVGDSSSAEQTNILPNDPGIVSNFAINTGRRKSLDGGRRGSLSIRPTTLPKIAMGGRVPPNTNIPATERLGSGSAVEGSKNDHQPVCWAPLVPNYTEFSRHLEQRCLPNLANTPHGLSPDQLQSFATSYQHHTLEILRRLVSSDGSGPVAADLEATMQRFWHGQILTSTDHLACLHTEEGIRIVLIADDYLYQVIDSRNPNISQVAADVLLRDVLESIPIQATQSIRQFAKSFESMIAGLFPPPTTTTTSIPLTVVRVKRDLAGRFSQVLRRRTSLNHLAQAVRGVLRNPDHSNQMSYDWMHIDFAGIRDQTTAWILVPGDPFLVCIETGFKSYLSDGAALPQWTQWLESIIDQSILMEVIRVVEEKIIIISIDDLWRDHGHGRAFNHSAMVIHLQHDHSRFDASKCKLFRVISSLASLHRRVHSLSPGTQTGCSSTSRWDAWRNSVWRRHRWWSLLQSGNDARTRQ